VGAYYVSGEAALAAAIVSGTFGLLGLIFGLVAAALYLPGVRKSRLCTAYAQGTVALEPVPGRDGRRAVYEYTALGETMVYESPFYTSRPRFKPGQQVDVYYDPQDATRVYVPEDARLNRLFLWVFGGLGGAFLLVALILLAVVLA